MFGHSAIHWQIDDSIQIVLCKSIAVCASQGPPAMLFNVWQKESVDKIINLTQYCLKNLTIYDLAYFNSYDHPSLTHCHTHKTTKFYTHGRYHNALRLHSTVCRHKMAEQICTGWQLAQFSWSVNVTDSVGQRDYWMNGMTSYRQISRSLKDARYMLKVVQWFSNCTCVNCRNTCPISEQTNDITQSRKFETSRDLGIRHFNRLVN